MMNRSIVCLSFIFFFFFLLAICQDLPSDPVLSFMFHYVLIDYQDDLIIIPCLPFCAIYIYGLFNYITCVVQVLLGLLSVWNVSFLGYPARVSNNNIFVLLLNCQLCTLVKPVYYLFFNSESSNMASGNSTIHTSPREVCPTYPTGVCHGLLLEFSS